MSVLLKISDEHYVSSDKVLEIKSCSGRIHVESPWFGLDVLKSCEREFKDGLATLMEQYRRRQG